MLLLDTHVVLWLALAPEEISEGASNSMMVARQQGGLSVAMCTLWEIALLHAKAKIHLDGTLDDFLRRVEQAYTVLPLTRQIAVRGVQFTSSYPKDPADRQIGATALLHGMSLVTADRPIRRSGEVPCIW